MRKKWLKIVLIVVGILIVLVVGLRWIVAYAIDESVNKQESADFTISYESFSINPLSSSFVFKNLKIEPKDSTTSSVKGRVGRAKLAGVNWAALVLDRAWVCETLHFEEPQFEIHSRGHESKMHTSSSQGMQRLFRDILTRGEIRSFLLVRGAFKSFDSESENLKSEVNNIFIDARDIQTDEVQLSQLIPFEMSYFEHSFEHLTYQVNDLQQLQVGHFHFNLTKQSLIIKGVDLSYNRSFAESNALMGYQTDLISLQIDSLKIFGGKVETDTANILDITANRLELDGIHLSDYRNKNYQRPPDKVMSGFSGMIAAIPLPLDVDTVQIRKSTITYQEVAPGKIEPGKLVFNDFYGSLYNLSSSPGPQDTVRRLDADFLTQINYTGKGDIHLSVPFDRDQFKLEAYVSGMNLSALTSMLLPATGIEVVDGNMEALVYQMDAVGDVANCSLKFNYDNLHVNVTKGDEHKKSLGATLLANALFRTSNMPGQGNYRLSDTQTSRDIYRGPVNFIWNGLKTGLLDIAASGVMKTFVPVEHQENTHQSEKDPQPSRRELRKERRKQRKSG